MDNAIVFLVICYVVPGMLCTWLTKYLSSRDRFFSNRKKILLAGLTLSWTPGVIAGGHGAFFGQMLVGLILFFPGHFQLPLVLINVFSVVITFLVVWYFVWILRLDR